MLIADGSYLAVNYSDNFKKKVNLLNRQKVLLISNHHDTPSIITSIYVDE